MPHFGLMDEKALGPEKAAFQRARLHIRGGKRRLRQGRISLGIITLYDALVSAMEWFVSSPERIKLLPVTEVDALKDDRTVYALLVRAGVLDSAFDYAEFDRLVEKSLTQEMSGYDYTETLKGIEHVMTRLGIMPFDEDTLPPEDPTVI